MQVLATSNDNTSISEWHSSVISLVINQFIHHSILVAIKIALSVHVLHYQISRKRCQLSIIKLNLIRSLDSLSPQACLQHCVLVFAQYLIDSILNVGDLPPHQYIHPEFRRDNINVQHGTNDAFTVVFM
jgi:hypothetical protein